MSKRFAAAAAAIALSFCLCACGESGGGVPVQQAGELMESSVSGERYAAMVISEDVMHIQRDSGKAVAELCVAVGDRVSAGDRLFSYDFEALELEHEKQQLELEKMRNEQTAYAEQLTRLEQQLGYTYNEADKSRLTLEINSLKTTQLENDYQIIAKEKSIADLEETLASVDVFSPVEGTVRSISEEEGAESYISIQQEGAYRLKGSLNELNMMGGLMPGARVRAHSRLDSAVFWEGTVLSIDTDSPQQNEEDYWYGGMDSPMTGSSSYVFFVELDSVEGLLLGQHLYVELAPPAEREGLWIPEGFLMDLRYGQQSVAPLATVWVEEGGRLAQREISLGEYDGMSFAYQVIAGITETDYIADPANPDCAAGAEVSRRGLGDFTGAEE